MNSKRTRYLGKLSQHKTQNKNLTTSTICLKLPQHFLCVFTTRDSAGRMKLRCMTARNVTEYKTCDITHDHDIFGRDNYQIHCLCCFSLYFYFSPALCSSGTSQTGGEQDPLVVHNITTFYFSSSIRGLLQLQRSSHYPEPSLNSVTVNSKHTTAKITQKVITFCISRSPDAAIHNIHPYT